VDFVVWKEKLSALTTVCLQLTQHSQAALGPIGEKQAGVLGFV
jgi:hypothetical protein